MALNILEVGKSAGELQAVDGLGGLAGVLEGYTEVRAVSACALCVVDVGGCVTDLQRCNVSIWLLWLLLLEECRFLN